MLISMSIATSFTKGRKGISKSAVKKRIHTHTYIRERDRGGEREAETFSSQVNWYVIHVAIHVKTEGWTKWVR